MEAVRRLAGACPPAHLLLPYGRCSFGRDANDRGGRELPVPSASRGRASSPLGPLHAARGGAAFPHGRLAGGW